MLDPIAGFEKIIRHKPQWGNPNCSRDNSQRKKPENLNNLYGCSVEMDYPNWGQR